MPSDFDKHTVPARERDLLSIEDVAALTGMSAPTVRRLIRSENLATVKVGRLTRIKRTDYLAFIDKLGRRAG